MSKRLVIISGTAKWSQLTGTASNLSEYLATAFRNAGFDVVEVKAESQSFFNTYINLTLKFNVFYQYGNQDALRSTTSLLENFTYNSISGNGDNDKILSYVDLKVTYDAGIPSISSINQSYTQQIKANSSEPLNVGTIATVNIDASETESDFLDNFSQILGVSKQNLIIGAVVIALVVLKR